MVLKQTTVVHSRFEFKKYALYPYKYIPYHDRWLQDAQRWLMQQGSKNKTKKNTGYSI